MHEPHKANDRISAAVSDAGEADHFERQQQAWQSQPFLAQVLQAVPEIIIVLNSNQEMVFANEALRGRLKAPDVGEGGHRRWGSILGCQHAVEKGGCGVTRFCSICGGLKAIETALRGTRDVQECRILSRSGAALDFQMTAVPIDFGVDRYVICTMADISAQKRCQALERLFFHDVLNTAVGIRGLADLLKEAEGEKAVEIRNVIANTAGTLVEQIQSPRLLTMAENNDLAVSLRPIDSLDFLGGILENWREQGTTHHLKLVVNADSRSVRFSSDKTILTHVLNSMVKNAFEASLRGMEIALGCYADDQAVIFTVRNAAVLAEDVQLQVFQRYFSTRGSGRGLGTYSMKLLTEQYLGGKVGFTSGGNAGTTFTVRLPLTLTDA